MKHRAQFDGSHKELNIFQLISNQLTISQRGIFLFIHLFIYKICLKSDLYVYV